MDPAQRLGLHSAESRAEARPEEAAPERVGGPGGEAPPETIGMVLCAGLLTRAGARRAVVNVHHLPVAMERAARAAAAELGLPLAVSREPVLAGTGGALREAR